MAHAFDPNTGKTELCEFRDLTTLHREFRKARAIQLDYISTTKIIKSNQGLVVNSVYFIWSQVGKSFMNIA